MHDRMFAPLKFQTLLEVKKFMFGEDIDYETGN